MQTILRVVKLLDTRDWYECQDIFLITDAIVSIVDTRLRLSTEILLKGMQARMQLEFYYEYLGQARHQMWVSLATFAVVTYTTPNNFEVLVKFKFPLQLQSLAVKP